jgi:diaminopimelate decarboxylase
MNTPVFLTPDQARNAAREFGTPVYIYDEKMLRDRAAAMRAFPNAFGLTVRYAMKALPNAAVLRIFDGMGLHIDASSGYEAERALRAGIAPARIQVTAQELPHNLRELVEKGVLFNACSLHQLRAYGELFPRTELSVRINPGLGSGHSNRTNVGGPSSSFGIWHEYLPHLLRTAAEYGLRITRMHTHIGSGSDPEVWLHCAKLSLDIAAELPEVSSLSLGGGYKVGRMPGENDADIAEIGSRILLEFETFAAKHKRKLHLEVEPGTWLAAHAGALLATVMDAVDTGPEGHRFLKIDSGMTDILRPSIYGAQHPVCAVPADATHREEEYDYLIAGHCCESGDILTPEPGNPEGLCTRRLPETRIGDLLVIDAAGAYCSAMAVANYNSFPQCAEVLLRPDGAMKLIRKRQTLEQVIENEAVPE